MPKYVAANWRGHWFVMELVKDGYYQEYASCSTPRDAKRIAALLRGEDA